MGFGKKFVLTLVALTSISKALSIEPRTEVLPTYSEEEMDAWMEANNISWPDDLDEQDDDTDVGTMDPDECLQDQCAAPEVDQSAVDKRIACSLRTVKAPKPHKKPRHKHIQVSQNFNCGNGGCAVTHIKTKTVGWSASGGVSQWISAGFDVSKSYTTGNSYSCSGHNQQVCVWWNVAHTAYDVLDIWNNNLCGKDGHGRITSPNKNNRGSGGYCVRGKKYCRNLFAHYWQ